MERNIPQTRRRLQLVHERINRNADSLILAELLKKAIALPADQQIAGLSSVLGSAPDENVVEAFVANAFDAPIPSIEELERLMTVAPAQLGDVTNPFIQLARALYPDLLAYREQQREDKGRLDVLQAHLLDVKQAYVGGTFIPDANSTFRMTFGHIRGYSPSDAVWYEPVTTLTGVIQKATGKDPFNPPDMLKTLYETRDFGPFVEPDTGEVPVALLYDTDTTGGNSGSPVMNHTGELVGVNFDRSFEATINDYAWATEYSRSIGVDIRYVLFILNKFADMQPLLTEMGVKPTLK